MERMPDVPQEAELDYVEVRRNNTVRIWMRFPDDTYLNVDVPAHSDASEEILETLSRIASEILAKKARAGVILTGFTEPPEDD
jgi:hypothetical protein